MMINAALVIIDEDDDLAWQQNIYPTAALTKYRDQLKSNYLCQKTSY